MCTPMVGYGPEGYSFTCVMCSISHSHGGHDWPRSWSFLAVRYYQERRGEDDSTLFIALFKPTPA